MRHGNYSDDIEGINWRVLKMLLPYISEYRGRIALAFLCLILAKLASVSMPFLLKYIVDGLGIKDSARVIVVPVALIVAYGLVRFANVALGELRDTVFGRVTERAIRRIGLSVFNHLHSLDLDFHLNRKTGGLSRDIERGTTGISFLMRFMVFNIVPTLLEIGMVVVLLLINYGLFFGLVPLIAVALYIAFSVFATEWRTGYVREANRADSKSNTRAIDSLLNYETVKYFTNEDYEAGLYDDGLAMWEIAKRKNRLSLFVLNGGQAFIISVAMTAMMALAAYDVAATKMTIGDFVLIMTFMMQLFMPLNFLGFVYREIKGSMANIEQLFSLLKTRAKIVDAKDAKALEVSGGGIEFKNVSFQYQDDRPILKDISFKVSPGQKVAVVGESGAGKSTLVKLLFRFYEPTKGKIEIDGQDISQVTLKSLRQSIGIVPQDTVLFNDTIFNNVHYGDPRCSLDRVEKAIDLAHLRPFIDSLPGGADTKVGERGLKVSGGEKQRIAIARTLLKSPPVLVFDEATSSLDSHSERAILKALNDIARNHTSIAIAHRLSTIKEADLILVFSHGRIVEQGSHQSLLSQQGVYAQLYKAQEKQALTDKTDNSVNGENC